MTDAIIRTHPGVDADAVRWHAVLARDAREDGAFVYAVQVDRHLLPRLVPQPEAAPRSGQRSSVRRPKPGNGFRACKRCRPDAMPGRRSVGRRRFAGACVYLANADGHPSLAALAARIGGSPYHLQRNFKRLVGLTPRQYAEACRLGKVKRRLRGGDGVTAAMLEAGYGSSSRFYERAVPKLGMPPAVYRRGGAGMSIQYTIVDSALGRLLVAATDRGVCAVAMGASDRELARSLAREYPAATIVPGAGSFTAWTKEILARLAGRRPRVDLPLHVQATAFQWQVWQALAAIPYGETRTYGEIAAAHRPAAGGPRRRARVRGQPGRGRDPLPPRGCRSGGGQRLPVGRRTKEGAAGARAAS